MSEVIVRQGDTVVVEFPGKPHVAVKANHDTLLALLVGKSEPTSGKSRRSKTAGTRFSRHVALVSHALQKGAWSTGASIDESKIVQELIVRFEDLSPEDRATVTLPALGHLRTMVTESIRSVTLAKRLKQEVLEPILRSSVA